METTFRPEAAPRPPVFVSGSMIAGRELMAACALERLDVVDGVENSSADLDVRRPLLEPAPPLESARAHAPALGQFRLVEMADRFVCPRRSDRSRGTKE